MAASTSCLYQYTTFEVISVPDSMTNKANLIFKITNFPHLIVAIYQHHLHIKFSFTNLFSIQECPTATQTLQNVTSV